MKRSAYIEFLRFFVAICIFMLHTLEILIGVNKHCAYVLAVMVEFFFILSGFLMMRHIMENPDEKEDAFVYTCKTQDQNFCSVYMSIVSFNSVWLYFTKKIVDGEWKVTKQDSKVC